MKVFVAGCCVCLNLPESMGWVIRIYYDPKLDHFPEETLNFAFTFVNFLQRGSGDRGFPVLLAGNWWAMV